MLDPHTQRTTERIDQDFQQGRLCRERIDFPLTNGQTRSLTRNQAAFLRAYSQCGTVKGACQASKLSQTSYKRWKKDEVFCQAFDDVVADFADQIEAEAIRRAKEGVRTILFTASGMPIRDPRKHDVATGEVKPEWADDPWYYEESFSDRLLELLLKAKRPDQYRERKSVEIAGATGLPVELDLTVRQLLVNDPELSERICRALEEAVGRKVE